MFVEEEHSCFEANGDLLFGGAPVVGIEDGLAADAESREEN